MIPAQNIFKHSSLQKIGKCISVTSNKSSSSHQTEFILYLTYNLIPFALKNDNPYNISAYNCAKF